MTERENLTLCFVIMAELGTRKRDGGSRWVQNGGYEWLREIGLTTHLIRSIRSHIEVITHQFGTCTCSIKTGKMIPTQNSSKSQYLLMISTNSSHLSFSAFTIDYTVNISLS
jgi:hypothetical protein